MQTLSYSFSEGAESFFSSPSSFFICESSSAVAVLFRVLSGCCLVENKNSESSVLLKINYFFSDFRENISSDLIFLDSFEEGLSLSDYEGFVRDSSYKNRNFYHCFLNEIVGAIYNEELEKHTAAYVHLYRAYEYLSYAFPMIYAAKSENFIGTFENLRKWMTNSSSDGNIGELRFHKSFVASLFSGAPEISSTVDININVKEEFKDVLFNSLTTKVLNWSTATSYTASTNRPDKIAVDFLEFHSFFVNLRNRFFHYSNARNDNIALDDIIDADLLFSLVNKPAINYIATIFHAIIRHKISAAMS